MVHTHKVTSLITQFVDAFESTRLDRIADALADSGYVILDDVFDEAGVARLRAEFDRPDCHFKTAGIGRQEDFTIAREVRGDRICWLEGGSQAATDFLAAMARLREGLNRRLFMGLFDYESHLAYYPVGRFYKKHVDAFQGRSNRVLSTVVYLNEHWNADDGGELLLYNRAGDTVLERVVPSGGRMIVFLSEAFPHEVLPAKRDRYSIAGWFRVNANTADRIDPPG